MRGLVALFGGLVAALGALVVFVVAMLLTYLAPLGEAGLGYGVWTMAGAVLTVIVAAVSGVVVGVPEPAGDTGDAVRRGILVALAVTAVYLLFVVGFYLVSAAG